MLGICIDRDRDAGAINNSQRAYLEWILSRFDMIECNPRRTPLPLAILTKEQAPQTAEQRAFMADKPYCRLLGSVTDCHMPQPLICCIYSQQVCIQPREDYWNALTHVLCYIRGTLDYRITYGGQHKDLAPVGYVDTDYAGDLDNRRSCTGRWAHSIGLTVPTDRRTVYNRSRVYGPY